MSAKNYIELLGLLRHPEGGYYKETYRSVDKIVAGCLPFSFGGDRNISTAIYYLLEQGDFSAFHRIKSDECWHFYAGQTLLVHVIHVSGQYQCMHLGQNLDKGEQFQFVVPAGAWFASEPAVDTSFSLVGCTVAPGFDFNYFEMAAKAELQQSFPQHSAIIEKLCR